MAITFTLHTVQMLARVWFRSFQAEHAIWHIGRRRCAHLLTANFSTASPSVTIPESIKYAWIACASWDDGTNPDWEGHKSTRPSPIAFINCIVVIFSLGPRSGAATFIATTHPWMSTREVRFAKGLECWQIFSPRFPIVHSKAHWLASWSGPIRIVSGPRWQRRWMPCQIKWSQLIFHW